MSVAMDFVDAKKHNTWSRTALAGPSGGGKTYTALAMAAGLGGNPAVVDTEHRRALHYADVFKFKHLPLSTFNPELLTEIVALAAERGINPLIIDSWSPFWEGTEGMLEQVDRATAAAGAAGSRGGWKTMRPVERRMLEALLSYPGNVIVTLRTKTDYVTEYNPEKKKNETRKVGLKPIQRDGLEYDFDFVGDMDGKGELRFSKNICPDLPDAITKPDAETGEIITRWLTRDAVGEPGNPLTIRDWMLDDGRTSNEVTDRMEELRSDGLAESVVRHNGDTVTLTELGRARWRALSAAEKAAREQSKAAAA